jgi:hypothetical protein
MRKVKRHKNGRTSNIHGLEELIFFKCSYFQKQSIDLMQTLINKNPNIHPEPKDPKSLKQY